MEQTNKQTNKQIMQIIMFLYFSCSKIFSQSRSFVLKKCAIVRSAHLLRIALTLENFNNIKFEIFN